MLGIRYILKDMDGIVRMENPKGSIVSIAFDDCKTDEGKIIQALIGGRVEIHPIITVEQR